MDMDYVQITLTVLLGASIANLADEWFQFTPRLSSWLSEMFD